MVIARGDAVSSPKPTKGALRKRMLLVNKPHSFVILSEAEQPDEPAVCLGRDDALDAASIQGVV
jgi:hypothetical protein